MVKQKSIVRLAMLCGLVCIAIFSKAQSAAEKGQPFIVNFSPKTFNYYPQNWSCVEDNRGLMYFGNIGCILEYDGASWRTIILPTSKQSTARSMIRDHEGRIFYSAVGDFGYLAPDSSGNTKCVSLLSYIPLSQRNFYDVWTIYEGDGGIYFQSRDYIFRLTKTISQSKETWQVKTWPASAKFMYAFYLDGAYYVHEQNAGLFKMINDSLELVAGSEFLGKDRMQVMLPYGEENGKHTYLVGMFYSGIYLYDGEHFTLFKTEADDIIKSALLYKGILLKNGTYALSTTGKGLIIIDKKGKILQKINRDVGLQDESVYAVYEDAQSNIWLAMDNGISRVETSSALTQFTIQSGVNSATMIVKRFNGILYLGTANGLMKFDSSSRTFKAIAGIPQTQVFKLSQDDNSLIIPSDGIFTISDKGLHLVRPTIGGDLQASCLLIAKKNPDVLYAGTALGVSIFTRNKKVSHEDWSLLGTIPKLDEQIWTLVEEDSTGDIWAGTTGSNVYRFSLKLDDKGIPQLKNTVIKIYDSSKGLKFGSGPVFKVKNKLYFPDDSSINSFNEHDKRFYTDTTFGRFKNGGGSSQFYMTEDSSGNVWIRAGKTLRLAIPRQDGTYKTTDNTGFSPVADGTFANLYPEKDGTIWACTTDGLIRYNASVNKDYNQTFKTLLRSINAGSLLFDPLQDSMHNKQLISYKNNSIRFEYASPFYEQEQKTKYQTWLEGFDKTWSDWWFNDYKEYTNLPVGQYTFHVRALNVFDKISTEALYHFEISAPWYRAWWAYILYAVVFCLLAFAFIRLQRSRVIAKERQRSEFREAKLRAETENEQRKNIELISEMGKDIAASLSVAHIIDTVYNHVNKLIDASVFGIGIYNKDKQQLEFPATREKGETLPSYSYRLDDTTRPASWCFSNKNEVFINDFEKEHQAYISDIPEAAEGNDTESIIYLPLIYKDKSIGVITAQSFNKNAYNEYHLNVLRNLATYTAVALDNADAYRKLQSTQSQLIQSEKMASLGELTAGIAHEIQNPLNFVNNFSEVNREMIEELQTELKSGNVEEAINISNNIKNNEEKINHHGKRADAIVKGMLQHSRSSTGAKEATDINALADEYLRLAYHGLRAKNKDFNAIIKTDFDNTIGEIDIIPQDIGRVLLNLYTNAFYAVGEMRKEEGGRKKVEGGGKAEDGGHEPTVSVTTKQSGNQVSISVSDNGNGIPKNIVDKIFQPFFTTKPTGQGTGLGLSLSYDIIKAHGGEIKVETREGEGTMFIIQLPIHE